MQGFIGIFKHAQLHPFVDHFTVALLIVGVLVDLAASLLPARLWLRYMALTLMILGVIAAWGSHFTGGWEAERVWRDVTGPAKDVLRRHAILGDYLPWVFTGLAIWRLALQFLGFLARTRVVYIVLAVLAALTLVYQGYLGGALAYDYGVGTALMPTAMPTPEPLQSNLEPSPLPTVNALPPTVEETPTPSATSSPPPSATPIPSASATPAASPAAKSTSL